MTYLNIGPAPNHRRVIEILDKKSYIHEVKLQFLTFLYTTFCHPMLYNLQKQKALDLIPADNQDYQPDVCNIFKSLPFYLLSCFSPLNQESIVSGTTLLTRWASPRHLKGITDV